MEIRLVKTGLDRRSYEDKLKAHDQMLAKLENELKELKGKAAVGELETNQRAEKEVSANGEPRGAKRRAIIIVAFRFRRFAPLFRRSLLVY